MPEDTNTNPHLKNCLVKELKPQYPYMKEILLEEYRQLLPQCEEDKDPFAEALARRCKGVVFAEISGGKDRGNFVANSVVYFLDRNKETRITSYGSSTLGFTPLLAMLHNLKTMSREYSNSFLADAKSGRLELWQSYVSRPGLQLIHK